MILTIISILFILTLAAIWYSHVKVKKTLIDWETCYSALNLEELKKGSLILHEKSLSNEELTRISNDIETKFTKCIELYRNFLTSYKRFKIFTISGFAEFLIIIILLWTVNK